MKKDIIQIRISDLLHAILKRWRLILICTLVGLVIGVLLSIVSYMRGEMSKEYAITSSFAVTSITEDGLFTTQTNNPNSNDIYLAENMVDSVIYVMRSDRVLNAAIGELKLMGVSARDISANLSMKQYNETQIVEMTLYWRSAEEGVQILNAINGVAPNILIETLKIGGVSVVNEPRSRYIIGGSMNAAMWVYMAILGMMISIGLSVLELLARPTLINAHDVENVLGVENLGEIPQSKMYFKEKHPLMTEHEGPEAAYLRESYVSAAYIVRNRLDCDSPKCLFVTSAAPNEGKTSVAAHLAMQLAEMENRVLLIDLDVHNPSMGSMFYSSIDQTKTLNALYHGDTTPEEAVIHVNGYLDLLPAVLERIPLPLDEAMLSMIRGLSASYDYVLIDTAPIGRTADVLSLKQITQAALFVIRYDVSTIKSIRDSLEMMEKSGVHVLGAIVNDIKKPGMKRADPESAKYYHPVRRRQTRDFAAENVDADKVSEKPLPPVDINPTEGTSASETAQTADNDEDKTEAPMADEGNANEPLATDVTPDAAQDTDIEAESLPEIQPETDNMADVREDLTEEQFAEESPIAETIQIVESESFQDPLETETNESVTDLPPAEDDIFLVLSGALESHADGEKKKHAKHDDGDKADKKKKKHKKKD